MSERIERGNQWELGVKEGGEEGDQQNVLIGSEDRGGESREEGVVRSGSGQENSGGAEGGNKTNLNIIVGIEKLGKN